MTTKVTPSVLADTAVVTGTYGGTTQLAVVTVDGQGRITFAANATPSIATTQLTGTITNAQLAGSITTNKITGLATSATTDTTNATNITSGTLPAARLPTGVVGAGAFGGINAIPVVTVDTTGRVTGLTTVTPSIPTSQLTGTIAYSQLSADVTTTLTPTGVVHMWPSNTAPTGYLLCDGTAVSRTTYNALYVLIGTSFGVGNGSTTFNLPNYLNRFPMGAGTGGTYAIGATGGSADAIVVSHTHTTPNHSHTFSGTTSTTSLTGTITGISESFNSGGGAATGVFTKQTGFTVGLTPVQNDSGSGGGVSFDGSHSHTYSGTTSEVSQTISTVGSSGTNANLPPYLGINFIIKT